MTLENLKIVAAIPCYNTEPHIGKVVMGAKKYVEQVIVINDGSNDQTLKAAQDAGATVLSNDINRGKGSAMLLAAREIKGDIILFIDGDGQHNPDEIPLILKPILDGPADIVLGSRFLKGSKKYSTPLSRSITNFIASIVISLIVSLTIIHKNKNNNSINNTTDYRLVNGYFKWFTDCTCGFRAVRNDSLKKLTLISDGYQIETEMIFEAVSKGLRIAEVPVTCRWGGSLSKLSIVKDGIKTIQLLMKKVMKDFDRKT